VPEWTALLYAILTLGLTLDNLRGTVPAFQANWLQHRLRPLVIFGKFTEAEGPEGAGRHRTELDLLSYLKATIQAEVPGTWPTGESFPGMGCAGFATPKNHP
jgi:hypothetical protein